MPPGTDSTGDDVPSWISPKFLMDIVRHEEHIIRDLKMVEVKTTPAVEKGENFLSTLLRVRVSYNSVDSKAATFGVIVKVYPPGDALRKFVNEAGFFTREINVYLHALPQLYQFACKHFPREHVLRFSPKSYYAEYPDKLVLEDLALQGFQMANRRDLLDLAHCRVVLKRLAIFHAISFVYAIKNPAILETLKDDIYVEKNREKVRQFIEPQMRCFVEIAEKWPHFENIVKKIRKMIPRAVDELMRVCDPRAAFFKVLNHGDCWVNNILFKYSPDGKVVDLRFVDYQMTRYASPALDITYFMFSSPQAEVRASNIDVLLSEYFEAFHSTVRQMGYKDHLLTLQDLQEDMRRVRFFGFTTSVGTLATALAEPSEAMDLSLVTEDEPGDTQDLFTKVHSSPKFREAFQQLLPYFDKVKAFD